MICLTHAQVSRLAELDAGYGLRLELYESEDGAEVVVHVLGRYGYGVKFLRLDGSLVGEAA